MTTPAGENTAAIYWPEPTGFCREPDGAEVTLTGDLPHWRRHISGQGTTYATGVLRLLDGDVPLLVPPAVYPRVGGFLGENAHLTVTGKVDRRGPIHLVTVADVTEPATPSEPTSAGTPDLVPWSELTPGRIIRYRHVARRYGKLAGRPLVVRRGKIVAAYPNTRDGQVSITVLNRDGSPNKALGNTSVFRNFGHILSVEPAAEQQDATS